MADEKWVNFGDANFSTYGGTLIRTNAESAEFFVLMVASDVYSKYAFYGSIDRSFIAKGDCYYEFLERIAGEYGYASAEAFLKGDFEQCVVALVNDFGYGPLEFTPRNFTMIPCYSMDYDDFKVNDDQLQRFMEAVEIPEEFQPRLTYSLEARYEKMRGIEDTLRCESWAEATAFAHEKLMGGFFVEVYDIEDGRRVILDPTPYRKYFEERNGEFPIRANDFDPDYGDEEVER